MAYRDLLHRFAKCPSRYQGTKATKHKVLTNRGNLAPFLKPNRCWRSLYGRVEQLSVVPWFDGRSNKGVHRHSRIRYSSSQTFLTVNDQHHSLCFIYGGVLDTLAMRPTQLLSEISPLVLSIMSCVGVGLRMILFVRMMLSRWGRKRPSVEALSEAQPPVRQRPDRLH